MKRRAVGATLLLIGAVMAIPIYLLCGIGYAVTSTMRKARA
jgi:hypothetical protein